MKNLGHLRIQIIAKLKTHNYLSEQMCFSNFCTNSSVAIDKWAPLNLHFVMMFYPALEFMYPPTWQRSADLLHLGRSLDSANDKYLFDLAVVLLDPFFVLKHYKYKKLNNLNKPIAFILFSCLELKLFYFF